MKKVFALVLALVMVLALSATAFAQTVDSGAAGPASITISNAANNVTYKVAKLFDATVTGTQGGSIAYTGTIPESLQAYFAQNPQGNITAVTGLDLSNADVQAALKAWAEAHTTASAVSDGSPLTFTNLPYGYYIITTTQGEALLTVDSTNPNATVVDKNRTPPVLEPKKYANNEAAQGADDVDNNVKIGDTVTYTVEFGTASYDGAGADAKIITSYIISDNFAGGVLTNVNVTSITVGGTPIATQQFANGTITIPWVTGTGTVADPYNSIYPNGAKIVITYTATVADTAAVDGAGNTNRATITYTTDGQSEPNEYPVEDTIYTYALAIKKVDEAGNGLAGATFQLPFYVKETPAADGAYIYAGTAAGEGLVNELTTPEGGLIIIKGVDNETYSFTETKAPDGYNKLANPVSVAAVKTGQTTTSQTIYLDENGNVVDQSAPTVKTTVEVTIAQLSATPVVVLNKTGAELPETGGIGTTIFYVVGALMMAAAVVLLITKKRVGNVK